jgi:hypothetical protein
MSQKDSKTKDRSQTTIAELLEYNRAGMTSDLPLPVRDFLERYAEGKPLPYTAGYNEWWYGDSELLIAVLADKRDDGNDSLPRTAHDYVQEYLYRLEESTGVHIWNDPDVLRAAYPLMMGSFGEGRWLAGEYPDALATKTALARLCTRRELADFYERHGLKDDHKGRDEMAGSAPLNGSDTEYALKAARVLANPKTAKDTKQALSLAVCELANATDVQVDHPAIVERALTVMLESMKKRQKGSGSIPNRRDAYAQLVGLLTTLEG